MEYNASFKKKQTKFIGFQDLLEAWLPSLVTTSSRGNSINIKRTSHTEDDTRHNLI